MTLVQRALMVVTAPQRRGAEVFAADLARSLEGQEVNVRTVYLRAHHEAALPLEPDDIVLSDPAAHGSLAGWSPSILRGLLAAIDDFDPDVVQVNGGSTVKYGALARRVSKGRWRLVYRNIGDPRVWMRGRLRPFVYKHGVFSQVDGLVAVSEETLAGHREIFGGRIPAIHIPRSLDVDAYEPSRSRHDVRAELTTAPEAPVLLFIGALSAEKRLDRLIRVFAQVHAQEPGAVLWVAGGGKEAETLAQLVVEAGLDVAVRRLGVREDIADLLHGADIVVLTSDTEGLPGVLVEAGAARLPGVATNVGGVAACLEDGVTGRVVDADDESGFAQAVVDLIADPGLRRSMGVAARSKVETHFALDRAAAGYLDFYGQLIEASA